MNIKKLLGLPLYLKFKESKIKSHSLIVNPICDFSLYIVLKIKDNFALLMDENFKFSFNYVKKYVNIDYNFELNTDLILKDSIESSDINLSEDFYNYFEHILNNGPSICVFDKKINNIIFILNPKNNTKGYMVDVEIKIYITNTKTKFKESISKDDIRIVNSNIGILKCNTKSKNLYLSMKRTFNVKKNIEVLTSELKF